MPDMSPQEEIAGLKALLNGWKDDSKRYEEGLREVRKMAVQSYDTSDFESDNWLELIAKIDSILAYDDQCGVCGDHHEEEIPRSCETGDGV